ALLATVVVVRRPPGRSRAAVAAVTSGAAGAMVAAGLLLARVGGAGAGAAGVEGVLDTVAGNLTAGRLADLPVEVAGQLWYLTVSTWGLFPLGLASIIRSLAAAIRRRGAEDGDARTATVVFVAIAVVAMFVAGSLLVRNDRSIDSLVHGRANESVVAPVLLIGLLGLVRLAASPGPSRAVSRALAQRLGLVAGTVAVAGGALVLGQGAAEIALPVQRINVLGLDALLAWRGLRLSVVLFSAAALGGAAVIMAASRRRPVLAATLAGLAFLPSVVTGQDFVVQGSRQRATEHAVADAVLAVDRRFGVPQACVGYDLSGRSDWHRANYELLLPAVTVRDFESSQGQAPCSGLVVSGRGDFAEAFPGSRRVMLEHFYDQTLWALPGPVHDRLAASGWLLTDDLASPVAAADRRYRIALADPADSPRAIAMRRNGRREVEVTVTHAGSTQPWPDARLLAGEGPSVRIAVRWYRLGRPGLPDGSSILDRTRVELPDTLFPGEKATVKVPLETLKADGVPIPAGTYEARVEVVQDGVDVFDAVGPPLILEVVVVGRVF
ncbi:MAG: hypothetical protein ACRDY5_04560, partial [Acidimicrobiales bacterium]